MIDFTNEVVIKWVDEQIKIHPEIIKNGIILGKDLSKDLKDRIAKGENSFISKPGIPIQEKDRWEKIIKVDWNAWYLYYQLHYLAGIKLPNYEEMSDLITRSPITIKKRFIKIQKELDDAIQKIIDLRQIKNLEY